MAITPRTFARNPGLLLLAATMLLFGATALWVFHPGSDAPLVPWMDRCLPPGPRSQWSIDDWEGEAICQLHSHRGAEAYRTATQAVQWYPGSAELLNLKGFVAGRNGDFADAAADFRAGWRVTGSPTGVFENNLAWTLLWQRNRLDPQRQQRVLMQAERLANQSLRKGMSCERLHTAMFVQYAMADLLRRTQADHPQQLGEAIEKYEALHSRYAACSPRIADGDELVVEEVASAAVMDEQMGHLAGVSNPTRHLVAWQAAVTRAHQLGLDLNANFCNRSVPVTTGARACQALVR